MRALLTVTFAAVLLHASRAEAQHPLLGSGHGLDHVTILTRNTPRSVELFSNDLGFTPTPYEKYENGFENTVLYLADETYIELWGVHDSVAAAKSDMASVLAEPDGLTWLILHVSSTDSTAAFLRARQHQLFGPDACCGDPWLYRLAGLQQSRVPGREIYFIEYNEPFLASRPVDEGAQQRKQTHANTAQALTSAWIAVQDPEAARKAYEGLGFTVRRTLPLPHLDAVADEIPAGQGTILLVHASGPESPVHAFLGDRPDRMMGLSVRVADLEVARAVTHRNTQLPPFYDGPRGKSFLVPPDRTGGVWLEFH